MPDGDARVYLWIPPDCQRVRGVVFANHNMIEQGILEHPAMRQTLAKLGFAEVWGVPYFDLKFDFNKGSGEHFEKTMAALADLSGYDELRVAPVVPLGHSACATYPWNFAAWNPGRTLAVLSVHGDAPQTLLTGYGGPNADWGTRAIDGVPSLMVMGEYEWNDLRLCPASVFLAKHPNTPLAFLCDAGRGHFDYADRTVGFLAQFIEKAAAARLPADAAAGSPGQLKPINPQEGWRIDRWRKNAPPAAPTAPWSAYAGNPDEAFWCFDEEIAKKSEAIYAQQRGKKPQLLSVGVENDDPELLEKGCGEPVNLRFLPDADGVTFHLKAKFLDRVPEQNGKATLWTGLPAGTPLEHAQGPIDISWIVGPAAKVGPGTFKIQFGRAEYTENRRNNDIWFVASNPGDESHKSIVQQAMLRFGPNKEGVPQRIEFPGIQDRKAGEKSLKLNARSDSGLPVSYYVLEGPAEVEGDVLKFTPIPPRAKYPVKVTVVVWQWGKGSEPKVKTAERVERSFYLAKP
jgi:hypothetical protein